MSAPRAIRDIRVYRLDLALRGDLRIATMSLQSATNVMVKILCDDGGVGWGEASPFHSITGETQAIDVVAAGELRQLLRGKDALAIEERTAEMARHLPHNASIRGALDMALYDVASRSAGMPLYRFLGGANRPLSTDVTIYLGNPEQAADRAEELVKAGFGAIKVKLGLGRVADLAKIEAIRTRVGPATILRVDANQAWDRVTGLRMLRALEVFDVELCEQPCHGADYATLKHISDRSPIPVMADESLFTPQDALRLVHEDVVPYFNIKLSKSGGIQPARKIAAIAEAGGRLCMAGCMSESRLGITAAAHFALAHPVIRFHDLDSFYEHRDDPIRGGITVRDGCLVVPEAPGIGAEPDEAHLVDVTPD